MTTPGLRLLLSLILLLGLPSCGMPGGTEWMWIGLIALLLFGGAKLPGLMRGLGSGIHEFKKGLKERLSGIGRSLKHAIRLMRILKMLKFWSWKNNLRRH